MKAEAVVAVEPWRVEYRPVEVPEPGDDDVVVRLTHSWISNGTEGSFIRGERIAGDTPRADSDPMPFPHVPGYQKSGIVERVGAAVGHVRPGDRVFASVSRVNGMFYDHGGHINPAITHGSQVWKLPDGLDSLAASGLVLTQVGLNTGSRPTAGPGDCAVVIGDGLVGHWTAQTLQDRGARVLMLGRHADRLARLTVRDGDATLIESDGWFDAIVAWASEGVQVVADTVGSIETIEALLPAMRHNGHIASAGFYGPRGRIDIQQLRAREITLHAPAGWSANRMETTLRMLAEGRLTTLPLITHRYAAAQAAEAYGMILHRRPGVLGVALDW